MALTDTAIRNAKARERDYKLGDGGGLYLLVTRSGGRLWRLKYRSDGESIFRLVGKRRLDRLAEMVGDPPKQAPADIWPS